MYCRGLPDGKLSKYSYMDWILSDGRSTRRRLEQQTKLKLGFPNSNALRVHLQRFCMRVPEKYSIEIYQKR